MTGSFRPSFVNMGSQSLFALALMAGMACQGPKNEVNGDPLAAEGMGQDPTPAVSDTPNLQQLRQMVLTATDLNDVLSEMDKATDAFEREPDFWELFGQTSLDYAKAEKSLGRTDALEIMYNDAEYAFRQLRELDPNRATGFFGHIYSLRMSGDFDAAWQTANDAIRWGLKAEMPADLAEEIGRAGLAVVIEAVQAGQPVPAAAEAAETHLIQASELGQASAAIPLADLLAWQNRSDAAREVLIEALIADPANELAVARLKNQAPGEALSVAWQRIARSHPDHGLVQWRLGEALWTKYWEHRNQADYFLAHEALNRAEDSFLTAMALEPSYQTTCQDWLHLVHTAHGWVYWLEGSIDDAATAFLASLEADPDRLETEAAAESLRLGIYSVEGYFFEESRLDKILAFHSRLFKTYSDNPDWTNNYAFACRDLGVAKAQEGKAEEATKLFQDSWVAYSRTVELAPQDVRLVNDRALISVYYLDEHWEEAERELHRALQLGAEQQKQMAADVPDRERRLLDEAIGDAWENLAYLEVIRRQRIGRSEEFLAESIKHFPFENRGGVTRIRQAIEQLRNPNTQEK